MLRELSVAVLQNLRVSSVDVTSLFSSTTIIKEETILNHITSIILMCVCIILSAYFSATETAFSSMNRVRIKYLSDQGNKRATLALKLSENYDRLLSTILIGNNIVNILVASIGTLLFADLLGAETGATVSTAVVTVLVLIFGEISPKSLAKDAPETFAMLSAPLLKVLVILLSPVNFIFTQWKKLLSKIFRIGKKRKLTEEELLTIVEEATCESELDSDESEIIKSAVTFSDLTAEDILIPRVDIVAADVNITCPELKKLFISSGFSRIPIYKSSIDNIVGIVHQKDLFLEESSDITVSDIMKEPVVAPITTKISDILRLLQKTKSHMAIIKDEYGGTMGILTMEDILEELVGEIWDEHDEVEEDIIKEDEYHYIVNGDTTMTKICNRFDVNIETDAITLSGYIMERMNKIPHEGESFKEGNLTFTVKEMSYQRITVTEISIDHEEDSNEDLQEEMK